MTYETFGRLCKVAERGSKEAQGIIILMTVLTHENIRDGLCTKNA